MKKLFVVVALLLSAFVVSGGVVYQASASTPSITAGPTGSNGIRAYQGPGKGEITLEWSRVSLSGENYSIRYGTNPDVPEFSAPHIGYITTYTVGNLQPGKKYYFKIDRIWTGNVNVGNDGTVAAVAPFQATTVRGTAGPIGRNSLIAKSGPKKGQVTIKWNRFFANTESYSVVYGEKPGQYIYGALDVRDATPGDNTFDFTIDKLQSGKRYYFALVPKVSGEAVYVTSEVSTVAQ